MTQPAFKLDKLRIDPSTGAATGPGGHEQLDPKVMAVLMVLAEHAGEVVTRETLHARVWPNAVVTDDALTRCLHELRRALARAGGSEQYRELIETLPKRGYRLHGAIGPPDPAVPAAPSRASKPAWLAGIAAIVVVVAALVVAYLLRPAIDRSIAVLPFLDMSESGNHGYLADGVTEEILNRLTQSSDLRVIARTSTFALKDLALDVPQIAARLDVRYVLEGSVRRSGDRVRITAQLIDASTNAHEWSETYDRDLSDLFTTQDEIAESVASALEVTLARDEPGIAAPANFEAYQRFLQGQHFFHRRAPGDVELSAKYYQEAVKLDPAYARAWAALAGAYFILERRQEQGAAARRAVELDPRLAVGHARLSQYYHHIGDFAKGDEHFRTAVALDPDDPLVLGFSASQAMSSGDEERAVALWRKIVAGDPLSSINRNNLGSILLSTGQLTEGLAELRASLELNPDSLNSRQNIIRALVLLGRLEEAQQAVDALPPGEERDSGQALLHQLPARAAEADAAFDRLRERALDPRESVRVAEVYAFRGLTEEAFGYLRDLRAQLEAQRTERPYLVWYFVAETRRSPFLQNLRGDPRWAGIVARPSRPDPA